MSYGETDTADKTRGAAVAIDAAKQKDEGLAERGVSGQGGQP